MKGVVIRDFPRAPVEVLDEFARLGTATVHEARGRVGLMRPILRPIYQGASIAGTAVTVSVAPGDNTMIHVAIEVCKPGDVLVVVPTSECSDGYFGELFATALKARGVRGTVIEAGCRDVAPLTEMRFPVWSKAVSAQGTVKETLGNINLPVVCAGQTVEAGDVIIADDDGVAVVPAGDIDAALTAARARLAKEETNRARFQRGELGLDVYSMRAKLAEKGLVYFDDMAAFKARG
ncbi:MAG TPA: 4-carboxy-4-hydroxy-2-oxoadipate aldolase/oxaloacetate decarboxylase [Azospirillum sp.]|nr:4-carboxy-4-hydroxy-2-oxoadipate aldolase/oxaloacetate decarboxylase [Azospirillum sp.]